MGEVKPEIVERFIDWLADHAEGNGFVDEKQIPDRVILDGWFDLRAALSAVADELRAEGRAAGIREAAEKLAAELPDALTEALARYKGDSAGDASGAAHHLYWVEGWDKLCAGEVRRILALLEQPAEVAETGRENAAGTRHESQQPGGLPGREACEGTQSQQLQPAKEKHGLRLGALIHQPLPVPVPPELVGKEFAVTALQTAELFRLGQPAEPAAPAGPALVEELVAVLRRADDLLCTINFDRSHPTRVEIARALARAEGAGRG